MYTLLVFLYLQWRGWKIGELVEKEGMENREEDKLVSLGGLEGRRTKKGSVFKASVKEDDPKTIEKNMIQEDATKTG